MIEALNERGWPTLGDYYFGNLTPGLSSSNWVRKDGSKPPYDGRDLGSDPTVSPGKEFEWRGKGKPGSKQGSWYNTTTGESLHPDLDHPAPIKPHWDYESAQGGKARLNTDGTWEWK